MTSHTNATRVVTWNPMLVCGEDTLSGLLITCVRYGVRKRVGSIICRLDRVLVIHRCTEDSHKGPDMFSSHIGSVLGRGRGSTAVRGLRASILCISRSSNRQRAHTISQSRRRRRPPRTRVANAPVGAIAGVGAAYPQRRGIRGREIRSWLSRNGRVDVHSILQAAGLVLAQSMH